MAMAIMATASLLVLLLAAPTVYGVDHDVGGNAGWALGVDYSTWASGQTFTVGDNLVFKYGSTHGVDQVSEANYNSCSSSKPLESYSGGNTKVALTSPGKMYFICPTPGHCSGGMKLAVTVVAASAAPSGSSPATPTTPSTTNSSAPAPTTTSAPPPKSGAVGGFGSISQLMGSLFVSSLFLALMS